jgi:predicted DNA-binding protein (UPF0251 family)
MFDEFSWAVGLFEGEGSISFSRNYAGHRYPRISIAMSDLDVIQRFAHVFPGGGHSQERGTNKMIHRYMIQSRDGIETFLLQLQPYLSEKKSAECAEALALIEQSRVRAPRPPTRRRLNPLSSDEIEAMRLDRVAGMPVAEIAEKYLIGKSHVSRLTKDYVALCPVPLQNHCAASELGIRGMVTPPGGTR